MCGLPPFLEALDTLPSTLPYKNAVYRHKSPLGPVHAQWWPCSTAPKVVLIFIPGRLKLSWYCSSHLETLRLPGNPGLLDFYLPFLSAIHEGHGTPGLALLSHGHIGHASGISLAQPDNRNPFGLTCQVQSAIEAYDAVKSYCDPQSKVILLGHSVLSLRRS
jgi:hypothetical protein